MFVNTLSFMCSDPTAVMTVRLLTDTTNAVPSTSTRESREPLLAARSHPLRKSSQRALVELDAAALDARERVLGELQAARRLARLRERVRERRPATAVAAGLPAASRAPAASAGALGGGRGRDRGGEAAGRDERGLEIGAHSTSVMLERVMPATPSTVTVVPEALDWTLCTVPVAETPDGLL